MASRSSIPDPVRAHGAWIFLFVAIGAGALVGRRHGVEVALLVGTAHAGAFLVAAAWLAGPRRKLRQQALGAALALGAPPLALAAGAEPRFLLVCLLAAPMALVAVALARRAGFLSAGAVALGVTTLCLAAPAAALAGGASLARAALLLALLATFYCWRSLRIAAPLEAGGAWVPAELRSRGLREAALAAVWALLVATALRAL